jgi:hypothetical protein
MSTELTNFANNVNAAYSSTYILLDNAADTTAGGTADIAYAGDYMLNIEGSFATAATVNIYVKRATSDAFILLTDLGDGQIGQYTEQGDVTLTFGKADKVYAQLSGITGTPAISAKLNFIGN